MNCITCLYSQSSYKRYCNDVNTGGSIFKSIAYFVSLFLPAIDKSDKVLMIGADKACSADYDTDDND